MTPTTDIGEETPRSLRVRLGISQETLARRAGVAIRTLSQIENGRSVRLALVQRVASALDLETPQYVAAMERRAAQLKAGPLSRRRARRAKA